MPSISADDLPSLPVPSLALTKQRWLESLVPFATDDEIAEKSRQFDAFASGRGLVLQETLLNRSRQMKNWIEDWWLDYGYFSTRAPLPWLSNVMGVADSFFADPIPEHASFIADPASSTPPYLRPLPPPKDPLEVSVSTQQASYVSIRATAHYTIGLLMMINTVRQRSIDRTIPVREGVPPLCMYQFESLWATRIAKRPHDTALPVDLTVPPPDASLCVKNSSSVAAVSNSDGSSTPWPFGCGWHVLIARHGCMYAVAADPTATVDDWTVAIGRVCSAIAASPVPLNERTAFLTGLGRDESADALVKVSAVDPRNAAAFELIQTALFVMHITDDVFVSPTDALYMAAGSTRDDGSRWFDKSLIVTVGKAAHCVFNAEHSASDAIIIADYFDVAYRHMVTHLKKDGFAPLPDGRWVAKGGDAGEAGVAAARAQTDSAPLPIRRVEFFHNEETRSEIANARVTFYKWCGQQAVRYFRFNDFGRDHIRAAGYRPDSFFQAALAIAYFRDSGGLFGSTYETGMTRRFFHGRTEVIRVACSELRAFVEVFHSPHASDSFKLELFKLFQAKHLALTVSSMAAEGVDRHIFGLKVADALNGGKDTDFLKDGVAAKAAAYVRGDMLEGLDRRCSCAFRVWYVGLLA